MTRACHVPNCFKAVNMNGEHEGDHDPRPQTRAQMESFIQDNIGHALAMMGPPMRAHEEVMGIERVAFVTNIDDAVKRALGQHESINNDASWAVDWWRHNRKAWGKLLQVRKGTRVRCLFCGGHPTAGGSQCPLCFDGFIDRDEAIEHLEMEMEMAHK